MQKQIYISFFAACALLAWFFRYEIYPASTGPAYRLDRWTGSVMFLRGASMEPSVIEKKPAYLSDKEVFGEKKSAGPFIFDAPADR